MRRMLLIDTCGDAGGVAVAEIPAGNLPGGTSGFSRVMAQQPLPSRGVQEHLMTAIAAILAESCLAAPEIDCLAIVTGPGSFTGVRIGLAAVKGLAEALGKPVVAVSRLAVLAAQAPVGDTMEAPVQAWLDAGRADVFFGRYLHGSCLGEGMLHGQDAADRAAGDTVVVMEEHLLALNPGAILVPAIGVVQALPLAAAAALAGRFADIALLDANYLRVPDAQLALEAAAAAATRKSVLAG